MRLRLWSCLALAACIATPASAGVIRGVVHVAGGASGPAGADPYPGRVASLPGAHGSAHGRPGDTVISVERMPAAAESAAAAAAASRPVPSLAQKDQAFLPHVLPVAAGTAVDFPNMDPIFHNVFSLSPVRRFDLGKYPRGHSRRITFPKPGLVNVYCDIHSNMAAYLLVLPHHGFAQADDAGRYALPPLPRGRYVLHVWHPDVSVPDREVDVPATGDVVVDVDF